MKGKFKDPVCVNSSTEAIASYFADFVQLLEMS